jgi:RNA polymerase sigma factor (sigma-70 family)
VAQLADAHVVASAHQADEVELLRKAIKQLSPERYAALAMFYLERMSLAEIAEALSLPLGTVKSRLHYAKQELKKILEGTMP